MSYCDDPPRAGVGPRLATERIGRAESLPLTVVARSAAAELAAAESRSFNTVELIGSLAPNSLFGCFDAAV